MKVAIPSQHGEFPCLHACACWKPRPCGAGGFPVQVVVDALTEVLGAIEDEESRQPGPESRLALPGAQQCSPGLVVLLAARGVGVACVRPLLAPPHQERTPVEFLIRQDGNPSSRHSQHRSVARQLCSPDRPSAVPVIRGVHSLPRCGIHSAPGRQNERLRSPLLLHDTKWPTTERRPSSTPRTTRISLRRLGLAVRGLGAVSGLRMRRVHQAVTR